MPVSDAGVDTLAFLEATEGLIKMFGTSLSLSLSVFSRLLSSPPALRSSHACCPLPSPLASFKTADLLGNPSFAIVQSDMTGNVAVSFCFLLVIGRWG